MAKKDTVFIDVVVDDKGTTKRVAVNAKKLGAALDEAGNASTAAGKGARTADRNLKGLSKQSSNTTKNFSKMAQGMTGGLVPAYAILASNVFAITAAFQFLKKAADFRVMQESQVAFTGATGVGMRTLTADIQAASDAMLDFQAASEAASIGVASGLNAGQITDLSEGAANLSKILGRDVTDSFNRLIRGVTKAEPELLDELGITLRLNDAARDYAATLGKNANDLTKYEKKQAVFNDVYGQLVDKYGDVSKATKIQANAITKLGVAFDRVMKHVKSFTATIGEPVAAFFTKNIGSLTAALALLAVPIVRSIIPGLDSFAEKSKIAAEEASNAFKKSTKELEKLDKQAAKIAAMEGGPALAAQTALEGTTRGGQTAAALRAGQTPTRRQLSAALRDAKANKGVINDMDKHQRKIYKASLAAMLKDGKGFTDQTALQFEKLQNAAARSTKKMEIRWKGAMATMQGAAAKFSKGVDLAMKGIGLVGIILMLKDIMVMLAEMLGFIKTSKGFDAITEQTQRTTDAFNLLNDEFSTFNDMQTKMGEGTLKNFQALGQRVDQLTDKLIEGSNAINQMSDFGAAMEAAGIKSLTATDKERLKILQDQAKEEKQILTLQEARQAAARGELNAGAMLSLEGLEKQILKGEKTLDEINTRISGGGIFGKMSVVSDAIFAEMKGLKASAKEFEDFFDVFYDEERGEKVLPLSAAMRTAIVDMKDYLTSLDQITPAQQSYLDVINEIEKTGMVSPDQLAALEAARDSLVKIGDASTNIIKTTESTSTQYKEVIGDITEYRTSVSELIEEIEKLNDRELTTRGKDFDKRVRVNRERLNILKQIASLETTRGNQERRAEAFYIKAKMGRSKIEREALGRQEKILQLSIQESEIHAKIQLAKDAGKTIDTEKLEQYNSQLAVLQAQTEELERQGDMTATIVDSGREGLASGLQKGISAFLKGEEKSLKDTLLGVVKNVTEAMIDQLSKNVTEKIMMKIPGFETEAQKTANAVQKGVVDGSKALSTDFETASDSATQKMTTALNEAATRFADAIRDACSHCCMGDGSPSGTEPNRPDAIIGGNIVNALTTPSGTIDDLQEVEVLAKKREISENLNAIKEVSEEGKMTFTESVKGFFGSIKELVNPSGSRIHMEGHGSVSASFGDTADAVQKGETVTKKLPTRLKEVFQSAGDMFKSTFGGLWDGLKGIMGGAIDGLGKLFQGLPDLLGSLFSGMGGGGGLLSFFFANGGVVKGGFREYAKGGIARGPHIGIIGEGKHNEAVVPLPDGKSIPIDFPKGAMGGMQTNNVGVTINIDNEGGSSTDVESDRRDAANLGIQIADIVQQKLLDEKRIGGILSPYGAA